MGKLLGIMSFQKFLSLYVSVSWQGFRRSPTQAGFYDPKVVASKFGWSGAVSAASIVSPGRLSGQDGLSQWSVTGRKVSFAGLLHRFEAKPPVLPA